MQFNFKQWDQYRWENNLSNRYYQVILHQNLFYEWEVIRSWGRRSSSLGRIQVIPCATINHARKLIRSIAKIRRQRGYVSITL